jgi:alkylation response protein AidB-like acyl-CoA dehydrogenase
VDFNLTEQQEMFQKSVRKFAETELTPLVDIMDKQNNFPHEIRPKLAEMNLYGIPFDPKYGGAGADHISLVWLWRRLPRYWPPWLYTYSCSTW